MAVIYKITNLMNQKIYIGKTIRTAEIRWKEHLRDYKDNSTNIPLYNAFKKYGIENFSFQILEDNIPQLEIDEKEKYYIALFQSNNKQLGYNLTIGGDGGKTSHKLSEDDVLNIKKILLDENNLTSFNKLGQQFHVAVSTIRSINIGESWHDDNLNYPLRIYDVTGLTIPKKIYKNIVQDLLNQTILMKDLQTKYNLSESQLTSINYGQYCYNNNNEYYKNIYNGDYPIRKTNRPTVIFQPEDLLYDLLFTAQSMRAIGEKYNIKGNTLQYIQMGKRQKDLTKNYKTPLRTYKEENQKIFLQLYPNYVKRKE